MSIWRIASSFLLPLALLLGIPSFIHLFISPLYFSNVFALSAGSLLVITGIAFLAWANVLFVVYGEGTMAFWDAPKKLIVMGPYRYVRNPIAIGIITALWGLALVFNSFFVLGFSMIYWLMVHLWLVQVEEQKLSLKFGVNYENFKAQVPRWIPLNEPVEFDPQG